jgi:hypothetical protein
MAEMIALIQVWVVDSQNERKVRTKLKEYGKSGKEEAVRRKSLHYS